MRLAKSKILQSQRNQPAIVLLRQLGLDYRLRWPRVVDHKKKQTMSFWLRNAHDLHGILRDAEKRVKELMVKHHPDRGGCEETCKRVSQTWLRLEKIFNRKGIVLCD
jgi:hypothetical protein